MQHLDRAKRLLATGSDEDLTYAALEMRFCIENVFYDLVTAYRPELPDTVLDGKTWQPGEIIDMIVEIDPYVETDRVVSIGFEPSPGATPKEMHVIGRQSGVDRKLVARFYHALGFYLHARTDRAAHDFAKLRGKLNDLLPRLEKFRATTILDGFAGRVSLKCSECGRQVAKRTEAIDRDRYLVCPNGKCGAIFEHLGSPDEGTAELKLLQANIGCKSCKADLFFPTHFLMKAAKTGELVRCAACGWKAQVRTFVDTVPLDKLDPKEKTIADRRKGKDDPAPPE
jgi:DNA-directed RNA polymerase subunit RPC12/RpoP